MKISGMTSGLLVLGFLNLAFFNWHREMGNAIMGILCLICGALNLILSQRIKK